MGGVAIGARARGASISRLVGGGRTRHESLAVVMVVALCCHCTSRSWLVARYEGEDEPCTEEQNDCHFRADCTVDGEATRCVCAEGYLGDGRTECRLPLWLDFSSPPLDPRIALSRASAATYMGADDVLRDAAVDEPRFGGLPSYSGAVGLVLEQRSQNLLSQPEDLSDPGWTVSGGVTADSHAAPDGTMTAELMAAGTTLFRMETLSSPLAPLEVLCFSYFAGVPGSQDWALGNTSFGEIGAPGDCGQGVGGPYAISRGEWWRRGGSLASCGDGANEQITMGIDATDDLIVWGFQLERGPCSSYVRGGPSGVREPDRAVLTDLSWLDLERGTLWVEYDASKCSSCAPALWSFESAAGDRALFFEAQSSPDGAALGIRTESGGTETIDRFDIASASLAGGKRVALAYDASGFALAHSTFTPEVITYPRPLDFTAYDRMLLGQRTGGDVLGGIIFSIAYWPERLSDEQLLFATQHFFPRGVTSADVSDDQRPNANLSAGSVPHFAWDPLPGTDHYEVAILAEGTLTPVCGPETVLPTAQTGATESWVPTACSLVAGGRYVLDVRAVAADRLEIDRTFVRPYGFSVLPELSFAISALTVGEGDGSVLLTVTSTRPFSGGLGTELECTGSSFDSATAGADFSPERVPLSFAAGADVATATLTILEDTEVENDEGVACTLAWRRTYLSSTTSRIDITILDND